MKWQSCAVLVTGVIATTAMAILSSKRRARRLKQQQQRGEVDAQYHPLPLPSPSSTTITASKETKTSDVTMKYCQSLPKVEVHLSLSCLYHIRSIDVWMGNSCMHIYLAVYVRPQH
jgi:hypothetical protein